MCDTLRKMRSRGRSGVPAIRLRCLSAIRVRRSLVVLIFINVLPVSSFQLPASSRRRWEPEAGSWELFCARLPRLLLQDLAGIPDALLLVGIGLSQPSDVRRHLPNGLPVDAGHGDVRLLIDRDVDPRGDVEDDRVRISQRKNHLLALDLSTVTDADDIEIPAEPFGDTADGVGHQAAREAVELAELRVLAQRARVELIAVDLEADSCRQRLTQLAFRALDLDDARLGVNLDALGNCNWFFAYTRHS